MKRRKGTQGDLVISSFDKERLKKLLATESEAENAADLEYEIERGAEVRPEDVPPDVVTMNSTVRVTDLDSGATHVYTIVFPADADPEKGRISILSMVGTALIGYRKGDVIDWQTPRGNRKLRVDDILYQPEAAGDWHL